MKYLQGFALFIITCSIVSACTPQESKPDIDSITVSFEHPQTKQKFKIVHAYELYQNFTEQVESEPSRSQSAIYKEEVITPVYNACFSNGEYINLAEMVLNVTPKQLTANKLLSEEIDREATEKSIKEALFKSAELLPTKNETTVCVFPTTNVIASMATIGAGKIAVLYDTYYNDEIIKTSIAHEYHHSVWTEKRLQTEGTVLDNIVFEGKAVMFEKLVYPKLNGTAVDFTYNKVYWSKIVEDLEKKDLERSFEITLGRNGLPDNYGYNEGYKMLQSYLDLHPNTTVEEWTALSAKEIFEKGNYLTNYQ